MLRKLLALIFALCLLSASALCEGSAPAYPARALMTAAQVDTVNSLKRVNAEGTFYTLDYTADYALDSLLDADVADMRGLTEWVKATLLAPDAVSAEANVGGGCSAFVAINDDGELIFGRNYDYVQNAQNILVHCEPENGYESVAMAAGGWLYGEDAEGRPIQLDDGQTDLSLLVALPYLLMDGMNEKGLMICVLTVDGEGTVQRAEGLKSVQTTTAMRLVLDRAANVPEALALLARYNMHSSISAVNFHFFLADVEGNYGILEYSPDGEMRFSAGEGGETRNVFADEDYDQRFVTNFYRLFPAAENGFDDGLHGLDRFEVLASRVAEARDRFSESEAIQLLGEVYQDFGATATHETQWSVVYNPSDLTARICPRVARDDRKDAFYQSAYYFDFAAEFGDTGSITCAASEPLSEKGD